MADKVRASHLLIKHQGSRRPASWKDPDGVNIRQTTKEDAIAQLTEYRKAIVEGRADFGQLAERESHCSSAKRGGDMGWFERGQMQKPFEDATYALQVGEISNIVDTDSGVHIIQRTG
ncbi:Peptidyl-prolyl cis-trans isomerase [Klebsormidium nitens]|uniref:Peptidyl-prolyl cis-trans isomerase n=1 Tax=Klebsormidium nitens TaxID=105231 RepID=A0A1Y1IDX9_KLENI|nr:Peptidyl-prolyl cis-trans isomerase [Klebsormidium nitens]|eukprot:GAQ87311.1 Peptidyl-prolyl cis-trans isomerase [Klebsormidium nitens]